MGQISYVFVRKDISNIRKTIQVGHACLKAGSLFQPDGNKTFLIVIETKDEYSLMEEMNELETQGIKCAVFYEPDYNIGYTSFCTEPLNENKKHIFSKYKLLVI